MVVPGSITLFTAVAAYVVVKGYRLQRQANEYFKTKKFGMSSVHVLIIIDDIM